MAAATTLRRLLLALGAVGAFGCASSDGEEVAPAHPCADVPIDAFKEIMLVDEAVVADERASNANGGAWSFRHLVEQLARGDPADFVSSWFSYYGKNVTINLFEVDAREGAANLLCPWWQLTPDNACDAGCAACADDVLDLSVAPFRLIAIVNRVDLSETDASARSAGEGRFVYALTDGPGDDPTSTPLEMTVIFEYDMPTSFGRDATYWAERWHALAAHEDYDDAFLTELQAITDQFISKSTHVSLPDAPSLSQIRTNERVLDWDWEQREFHLTESALIQAPTLNTPDSSLNFSAELRDFLLDNEAAVLAGSHVLPATLTGGAAVQGTVWDVDGVSDELRTAFATNTCNGCHLHEASPVDVAFNISPLRTGIDRLSPFVHNPKASTDDLRRRAESMRRALCRL